MEDLTTYWNQEAHNLQWFKYFDNVITGELPNTQWFKGGLINASVNCLDRHLELYGNKTALHWIGEDKTERIFTYLQLHYEVNRYANALKAAGLRKGDCLALYLGSIPELPILMLACSRIGVIHSVIFAGLGVDALATRLNDLKATFIVTADGAYRRGKIIPLHETVQEVTKKCPLLEKIVVINRVNNQKDHQEDWFEKILKGSSDYCEPAEMNSNDPLFILYTSGTTGSPKGIVHSTAGYLVGANTSFTLVFEPKPEDVYWCTADHGWITGHTYGLYGPLLNTMTIFMYEGTPDWPESNRIWQLCEKYGVTILYTAPTLIRQYMRQNAHPCTDFDLSSLRLLGSVGEPIGADTWEWYQNEVGGGTRPIVDTWWQTETGMIMIAPQPSLHELKPGSATHPLPGISTLIVDDKGCPQPDNTVGHLIINQPWPAMCQTVWNDHARFLSTYWERFPGYYTTGDLAYRDEDGYYWLQGRSDDIIIVSGHNISATEIENTVYQHEAVAEAAAIGVPDVFKGNIIVVYVVIKQGIKDNNYLAEDIKAFIRNKLGPIYMPKRIIVTESLPKTRSGKILRRLLREEINLSKHP